MKQPNRKWRIVRVVLSGPILLLVPGIATAFIGVQVTTLPPAINMSSTGAMSEMGAISSMGGMTMPLAQPIPAGTVTPLASLTGPLIATQTRAVTLTAEPAPLTLGPSAIVDAWTYNGTAPGPTLRVRQGDLVVVTLTNHLPAGVSIHWHGVAMPNAEDGVAGLTQDAVKPGESYTYRFLARDSGTYWYHSHQQSLDETTRGLFGLLVVDPATPAPADDVDLAVALHTWSTGPLAGPIHTINNTTGTLRVPAQPGQWVRLRIANTGGDGRVTLLGAPFSVVALDGHDLHGPTPLVAVPLPVGEGQRYDIRFRMPESGAVALVTANSDGQYQATPAVVVGPNGKGRVPTLSRVGFWDGIG